MDAAPVHEVKVRIGPLCDQFIANVGEEKFWEWVRMLREYKRRKTELPRAAYLFANAMVWIFHPIVSWKARNMETEFEPYERELKEVGL